MTTVRESLEKYIRRRRPPRRPRQKARTIDGRRVTPIRKVRSKVAHAALEVLRLRRGEGLSVGAIVSAIDNRHPGLLQGNYRSKYKVVHRALSRVLEVQRNCGRFWLPDAP